MRRGRAKIDVLISSRSRLLRGGARRRRHTSPAAPRPPSLTPTAPFGASAAARRWHGTPYHDQASLRDVGCDCLGLARGVWREVVGSETLPVPPYSRDWGEIGSREVLADSAARVMIRIDPETAGAGAAVLFRMRAGAVAKHLGIVSAAGDAPRFIHAYTHHGVIDSPLTAPWRNRIAARFRFP